MITQVFQMDSKETRQDYLDYIASKEWQDRRWKKIRDDGTVMVRCEKCLGFFPSSSINVHHLTYENLGREDNRDLQILCRGCHEREHGIENRVVQIEVKATSTPLDALTTGFADVDSLTGGIKPGEMVVLGSQHGVGKSALALCIARHVAIALKMPTLFVSFEMDAEYVAARAIGQISGVPMRSVAVTDEQAEACRKAASILSEGQLYISDSPTLSVDQIAKRIEANYETRPIRLLVVDYIQQLTLPAGSKLRDKAIAEELRRLRQACKTMGVACLALTGLKRSVDSREDHLPAMADFFAGDEIEHDADQVWALWRRGYFDTWNQQSTEARLLVLKNRRAACGAAALHWIAESMTFTDSEVQP